MFIILLFSQYQGGEPERCAVYRRLMWPNVAGGDIGRAAGGHDHRGARLPNCAFKHVAAPPPLGCSLMASTGGPWSMGVDAACGEAGYRAVVVLHRVGR
eukprot:5786567-Pyramimonas_sp.AAC.1